MSGGKPTSADPTEDDLNESERRASDPLPTRGIGPFSSRAGFGATPWPALLRYNPRVVSAGADGPARAEWREAGLHAADLDQLQLLAVKLAGVTPAEWPAVSGAAAQAGMTARQGRQGALTPILLAGPRPRFDAFLETLGGVGLVELAAALRAVLEAADRPATLRWTARRGEQAFARCPPAEPLSLGGRGSLPFFPWIMGVVNVTPDSFSDGGAFLDRRAAVEQGLALAAAGAAVVDVGGESTRPGATPVSAAEELDRVLPVIEGLASAVREGSRPFAISVDTSKAAVARAAVEAGALLVNDVTALAGDEGMPDAVRDLGVPVCLMHMQGNPRTMQVNPRYDDLMGEILLALRQAMARGAAAGIPEDRFLVDPGIGFGKTVEHNLGVLCRLEEMRSLGRPIVVGTSRKSFIGRVLAEGGAARPVGERLMGTAATVAWALGRGAAVVRVHDVAPMADVVRVVRAIQEERAAG